MPYLFAIHKIVWLFIQSNFPFWEKERDNKEKQFSIPGQVQPKFDTVKLQDAIMHNFGTLTKLRNKSNDNIKRQRLFLYVYG